MERNLPVVADHDIGSAVRLARGTGGQFSLVDTEGNYVQGEAADVCVRDADTDLGFIDGGSVLTHPPLGLSLIAPRILTQDACLLERAAMTLDNVESQRNPQGGPIDAVRDG